MTIFDILLRVTLVLSGVLVLLHANTRKTILTRDQKPYLIRWTVLSNKWFSLKFHKILMSDEEVPHDHPWSYISVILWGSYIEERFLKSKCHKPNPFNYNTPPIIAEKTYTLSKLYKVGSILWRKGDKLHRLILPNGKFCLTMVITFKKWREWGFMTKDKWIHNAEYLNNSIYRNDFK